MRFTKPAIALIALVASLAAGAAAHAETIFDTFEGETAGSNAIPAGWSLVTSAGSPTYVTTALGEGSNGAGGSSGLAAQVSSTAFVQTNHPGAFLVNNTVFDATRTYYGQFDIRIVHEDAFDDVTFSVGNISTGVTGAAGKSLTLKLIEGTSDELLANGANTALSSGNVTSIVDSTWFHVRFAWVPGSGTTGNFRATVGSFTGDLLTRSTTGFTFDSATTQFGFGSVNDTARFDNVDIKSPLAAVSTLTNSNSAGSTLDTGSTSGKAMNFVMPGIGHYMLSSVVLDLSGISAGDDPLVELWSDDGSGIGALIETLTDPASLRNGFNEFTSAGTLLDQGETYWIVVRATAGAFGWRGSTDTSFGSDIGGTHTARLFPSASNAATPGTWAGSSTTLNVFQVNVVAVPTPAALPAGLALLAIAAVRRRRLS